MLGLLLSTLLLPAPQEDAQPLSPGSILGGRIKSTESSTYLIDAQEGQVVEGSVWQKSVDVRLDLTTPSGELWDQYDHCAFLQETFRFVAPETGTYRIEVHAKAKSGGEYRIHLAHVGPLAEDPLEAIDRYMRALHPELPGVQLAVLRDGEVLYQGATGLADIEHSNAMTLQHRAPNPTVFRQMAQVGILNLVDRGSITLETPVHELLPGFPAYEPPVLMRHALTGRTGLPDTGAIWSFVHGNHHEDSPHPSERMGLLHPGMELQGNPGEKVDFHDTGIMILLAIIDLYAKDGFEAWMERSPGRSAGLKDMDAAEGNAPMLRRMRGYYPGRGGTLYLREPKSDAPTVFLNMEDWIRWSIYFTTPKNEETASYRSRLMEIGASSTDQGSGSHSASLIDEEDGARILRIGFSHGGYYLGTPETTASRILDGDSRLDHPGRYGGLEGLGGRGGRGKKSYQPSGPVLDAWSGSFVGEDNWITFRLEVKHGRIWIFPSSGRPQSATFGSQDSMTVEGTRASLQATGRDESGKVTGIRVRLRRDQELVFRRAD